MPITGPASYLPTLDQFIAHWGEANIKLGVDHEVELVGGVTVTDLVDRRTELEDARDKVSDTGFFRSLARATLNDLISALQARLVEFNARVRADLANTPYARVLPAAFQLGDAEDSVREALRGMRALWAKINILAPVPTGLVLPLVLLDDYTYAMFDTDMTTLRTAYKTLTEKDQALKIAREERNDLQDVIYAILKAYRLKLPTAFPVGDAMVDSMPALTPAGGHTPAAIHATGVWDATAVQAKITWNASTDADLDHYEVRGVAGDDYVNADESILASIAPTAAREYRTDFALTAPGVTAGFKVYVVLTLGNEAGSEPVYVARPAAV
jgi:hypothetical protein